MDYKKERIMNMNKTWKLSNEDVHEICRMIESGISNKEISERYNISPATISDIKIGRRHPKIASQYDMSTTFKTDEEVHQICKMMESGCSNNEIYEKMDVTPTTLSRIRHGKTYKKISSQYNLNKYRFTLDPDKTHEICRLLENNEKVVDISKITGVSEDTISNIKRGAIYTEISSQYNIPKSKRIKLVNENTVHNVCQMLQDGHRNCDIAIDCNVTKTFVSHVRNGILHKEISKNYEIKRYKRNTRLNQTLIHDVAKLLAQNLSITDVAKRTKTSRSNVYRIKNDAKFSDIISQYKNNINVKEDENDDISNE